MAPIYSQTQSSTTIELRPIDNESTLELQHGALASASASASIHLPAETESILATSHLADANAPDGGYGWVVVFSCFVITWWFIGTTYCWGVIQAVLVDQGLSQPSTLSFVGSLTASAVAVLAIINARVIRALGARKTGLIGIALIGLGEIFAGFSTENVGGLFATIGVIMGIGTSLCFMVVYVTPAQYFNKKRGLANGIVYAGGGLGGTVISFAMNGLLQRLGPAWTFRVIGFTTLITGLPVAFLIKERAPIKTTDFVDWRLFRHPPFIALFLGATIATFPLFVPPFFLPLYAASLGLFPSAGAGLVAGFNFSSALGRLSCGFASDILGPVNTLFITLLLSALSMLILWPFSTSIAPLITFVVLNGAANGGFFATMPTVVGNVFGSRRISVVMGMVVTGWAGGYLMGAPIAGYLLAAYGGQKAGLDAYHPAMFYAGSMALGAAGLVAGVRIMISREVMKRL